jgi:hypothetical protein
MRRQPRIITEEEIFKEDPYCTYLFVKNKFRHNDVVLDFPDSEWNASTLKGTGTSKPRSKPRLKSYTTATYLGMVAFKRFFIVS